ncbi:MAG: glycosyltransferase family 2 protein [Bacteroidales bacterium]|nr:glycosyltransferase family 2 protein [Bacteroidales bacterium]
MPTDLTLAICMYNAEDYITETLQCILAQTKQDFHLLILDDCSTDNCANCVEHFFNIHPRQYELIRHNENKGLAAMRHKAEQYAQTQYLLFVDADDLPVNTLVEKLYTKITSDNDLMAVGCYMDYINDEGKPIAGGIYLGETTKKSFYSKAEKEKLIFMPAIAIFDRELALSVGGHNIEGFPIGKPRYQDYCEDLDLWTRMSDLYKQNKAIIVIPEVLYHYRKHIQSLSANTLPMLLRMRHVKQNLKRRRQGKNDMSFIDFYAQLTPERYQQLKSEAKAADMLRMGYYNLRKGKYFSGLLLLCQSICASPSYFLDKIKHNLLHKYR